MDPKKRERLREAIKSVLGVESEFDHTASVDEEGSSDVRTQIFVLDLLESPQDYPGAERCWIEESLDDPGVIFLQLLVEGEGMERIRFRIETD